jgi:hypothetical protein
VTVEKEVPTGKDLNLMVKEDDLLRMTENPQYQLIAETLDALLRKDQDQS